MKILTIILLLASSAFAQATQPTAQPSTQPANVTVRFSPAVDAATQIQAQLDQLKLRPGSTLTLTAGTYLLSKALFVADSSAITLTARGQVKLKALPTMPLGPWGNGDLIWIQNCQGVTVENIGLDASMKERGGFNGAPQTIGLNWSNDVLISGCTFSNSVCDDILMWGGSGSPNPACRNIRITHCRFAGSGRNAISVVNAQFVRIDANSFNGISANGPASAVDVEPNWGDPDGQTHHVLIEGNAIANCTNGILAWNIAAPHNVTITHNTITGCTIGIESQLPGSAITFNTITGTKSYPICTGGGSVAAIWGNTITQCPASFWDPLIDTLGPNLIKN